jgi:hypothetical protein
MRDSAPPKPALATVLHLFDATPVEKHGGFFHFGGQPFSFRSSTPLYPESTLVARASNSLRRNLFILRPLYNNGSGDVNAFKKNFPTADKVQSAALLLPFPSVIL